MVVDGEVKGVITIYLESERKIDEKEMEMLKTMADDLAFAIKSLELDELKRKAYKQIEKTSNSLQSLLITLGIHSQQSWH